MELRKVPILVEISLGAILEEKSGQETIYSKQFFVNFPRNGQEEDVDLEMEVESPEEAMNQL